MSLRSARLPWLGLLVVAALCAGWLQGCGGPQERKAAYRARAEGYMKEGNLPKARVALRNVLKIDPADTDAYLLWARIEEKEQNWRSAFAHYLKILELNPTHQAALTKAGKFYLEARDADKVAEVVAALSAAYPGSVEAESLRVALLALQGRTEEATAQAAALAERFPGEPDAALLLANLYSAGGRFGESARVLMAAHQAHPADVDLMTALATTYVRAGEAARAEEMYRALTVAEPYVFDHRLKLARFYDDRRDYAAAEQVLVKAAADEPSNETRHLALADYQAVRRTVQAAEASLASAIERLPRAYHLQFALGALYEQTGRADDAQAVYQRIAQEHRVKPVGQTAAVKLAYLAWSRNDQAETDRLLRQVLEENPRSLDGLLLQGRLALAHRRYSDAVQVLRLVVKDQPELAPAHLLLGQAHMGLGETALARERLEQAVALAPQEASPRQTLAVLQAQERRFREATEHLRALLGKDPLDRQTLGLLLEILIETKEWTAAEQTLQRFEQAGAAPLDIAMIQGRLAEARQQRHQAIEAYARAVSLAPAEPQALTALTRALIRQGQTKSAESRLRQILAQDPRHPVAHGLLADLLMRERRDGEAEIHFKEAVTANPRSASAWLGWATLKRARGLHGEALDLLAQARAHQADGEEIEIMAAALLTELARPDEAMKKYEELLARNPRSLVAANNLASLLADHRGDPASLAKAFALTRQFETGAAPLLDTAGWVRVKMGHLEEGIRLLSRAAKEAPADPQIHYHLGYAYYKGGKPELAGPVLQKALAGKTRFSGEEDARKILAEMAHRLN